MRKVQMYNGSWKECPDKGGMVYKTKQLEGTIKLKSNYFKIYVKMLSQCL